MAKQKAPQELRELERTYRRMQRKLKRESGRKSKLPLIAAALLLLFLDLFLLGLHLYHVRSVAELPESQLDVYVLDVGQGDAILLRTATHAVLVDAGDTDSAAAVVQMLQEAGVRSLDAVINSHPHADHLGGMQAVLEQFPVKSLYFPDIPEDLLPTTASYLYLLETAGARQIPAVIPKCGEELTLGAASLEFLSVDNAAFEDLNNCSLGCLVTCGGVRIFMAGDLEAAGEAAFLSAGLVPKTDVLKVSHHGGSSSTTEAFLSACQPKYALISCGSGNDYGHPSVQCLSRLLEAGSTVYRTDLDGTLHFATDGVAVWQAAP